MPLADIDPDSKEDELLKIFMDPQACEEHHNGDIDSEDSYGNESPEQLRRIFEELDF